MPVVCPEMQVLLQRVLPASIRALTTARWTWAQRGYTGWIAVSAGTVNFWGGGIQ